MNANSSQIKYRIDNSSFVNAPLQNDFKYNIFLLSLYFLLIFFQKKKTQGRPVGFTQDDAFEEGQQKRKEQCTEKQCNNQQA